MKTKDKDYSIKIAFLYLICSFFLGLLFSILALRAKKRGKVYFWWLLLSLLSISFFGYISCLFYVYSSPIYEKEYYYLGLSTIISNVIALLILTITILLRTNTTKT